MTGAAPDPVASGVPEVPRFTHDAFPTRRLDACVAFYTAFTGLRVVRTRGERGARVAWLAPHHAALPIFVFVEEAGPPAPVVGDEPLLRHLGFELDSRTGLDALHRSLIRAGHAATTPRVVDEVVGYVTLVRDPDGRVVEFSHGQDVSPRSWDRA
jgi:catechol 2,3-dioxygenase-like lactoylglutathione lyase family enzyme